MSGFDDWTAGSSRVSLRSWALCGSVVLLLLVGLVFVGPRVAGSAGGGTAGAAEGSEATQDAMPAVTPSAEHDHGIEVRAGAEGAAWAAAEGFLSAWTSTDAAYRAEGFSRFATSGLAEGLESTAAHHIVTARRVSLAVVGSSPYSTEFVVVFEGDVRVHLLVVSDEGSSSLVVAAVERE